MMKIFMFFLFLSNLAYAQEVWQRAAVKVTSAPCSTQSPKYEGSGLLFTQNGELFVLTSEHVIIHDKSPLICHQADNAKLSLLTADVAAGLALLKLEAPTAEMRSRAAVLKFDDSFSPKKLAALGFPAGSADLVSLTEGSLLSASSHRALIPSLKNMIEAAGMPVEFGMSGGLLLGFDGNHWQWQGLLSHQVLPKEAGSRTQVKVLDSGLMSSANDLTLAIPAKDAINWLQARLKNTWTRNSPLQLKNIEAFQFGPLLFRLEKKTPRETFSLGAEIGGSDGTGIGGMHFGSMILIKPLR